jgi:hypothetical protein
MTMIYYHWLRSFTWTTYFECTDSSWFSNNPIQCEYLHWRFGKDTIKSIQKIHNPDLDIEVIINDVWLPTAIIESSCWRGAEAF